MQGVGQRGEEEEKGRCRREGPGCGAASQGTWSLASQGCARLVLTEPSVQTAAGPGPSPAIECQDQSAPSTHSRAEGSGTCANY